MKRTTVFVAILTVSSRKMNGLNAIESYSFVSSDMECIQRSKRIYTAEYMSVSVSVCTTFDDDEIKLLLNT